MNQPILQIENLKVSFLDPHKPSQKIEAVKGVSLELEEGAFTSLAGESGSGKSVTSLLVTRLIKPREVAGKIFWRPSGSVKDLLSLSEKEFLSVRGKEISYVFQDPASSGQLYAVLTPETF